jgi:hypothetical protein
MLTNYELTFSQQNAISQTLCRRGTSDHGLQFIGYHRTAVYDDTPRHI